MLNEDPAIHPLDFRLVRRLYRAVRRPWRYVDGLLFGVQEPSGTVRVVLVCVLIAGALYFARVLVR